MKPRSISERTPFSVALRFAVLLALLAAMLPLQAMIAEATSTLTFRGTRAGASIEGTVNDSPVSTGAREFRLDFDEGPEVIGFCVDLFTSVSAPQGGYEEQPWSDLGPDSTDLRRVLWILDGYVPSTEAGGVSHSGVILVGSNDARAAAVQAAIWHFTDDFILTTGGDIATNYNAILAAVNAIAVDDLPAESPPELSLSVTPSELTVATGSLAGPYTVTASVSQVSLNGPAVDAGGNSISALTLTPNNGSFQGEFYIEQNGDPSEVEISADVTVPKGRLFEVPWENENERVQRLILAEDTTARSTVKAEASFEPSSIEVSIDKKWQDTEENTLQPGAASFEIELVGAGTNDVVASQTIQSDQTAVFGVDDGVVASETYRIDYREVAIEDPLDGCSLVGDPRSGSSADFTVQMGPNQLPPFEVINEYDCPEITVSVDKEWEDTEGDPLQPGAASFEIELVQVGTDDVVASQTIPSDGTATFGVEDGLVAGENYRIDYAEVANSDPLAGCEFVRVEGGTGSTDPFVAGVVETLSFTVTNVYDCLTPVEVEILKQWQDAGGVSLTAPTDPVSFTVELFQDGERIRSATVSTDDSPASAVFGDLRIGTTYNVSWTELTPPDVVDGCGFDHVLGDTTASFVAGDDPVVSFTAINVYDCPEVTVSIGKDWEGVSETQTTASPTFSVTLTPVVQSGDEFADGSPTVVTAGVDEVVTFDDLEVGSLYRIDWQENPDTIEEIVNGCVFSADSVVSGTTGIFEATVDGPVHPSVLTTRAAAVSPTEADFAFTAVNRYDCPEVEISITKDWVNVSDPGDAASPTFEVTLTPLSSDDEALEGVSPTVFSDVGVDEVVSTTDIIHDQRYRISWTENEGTIPAALQGCTFSSASAGSTTFTADGTAAPQIFAGEVSNVYDCPPPPPPPPPPGAEAEVTVAKVWEAGDADVSELEPTFTITLQRGTTTVATETGVAADETVSFDGLINNVAYTVTFSEDADSVPTVLDGCVLDGDASTRSGEQTFTTSATNPAEISFTATNVYDCEPEPAVAVVSVLKEWTSNLDQPLDTAGLAPTFTVELSQDGAVVDTVENVAVGQPVAFDGLEDGADYELSFSEDADSIPADIGECSVLADDSTTSGSRSFSADADEPTAVSFTAVNAYECPDVEEEIVDPDPEPEPEPEADPEFFATFVKVWAETDQIEDFDADDLAVTFLVDGNAVAPGTTIAVEPGDELTVSETVGTGLPDTCSWESDLPEDGVITIPEDLEDGAIHTVTVTNTIACVEGEIVERPEEEATDDDRDPTVVVEVLGEREERPLPRTGGETALLTAFGLLLAAIGMSVLLLAGRGRRLAVPGVGRRQGLAPLRRSDRGDEQHRRS